MPVVEYGTPTVHTPSVNPLQFRFCHSTFVKIFHSLYDLNIWEFLNKLAGYSTSLQYKVQSYCTPLQAPVPVAGSAWRKVLSLHLRLGPRCRNRTFFRRLLRHGTATYLCCVLIREDVYVFSSCCACVRSCVIDTRNGSSHTIHNK